MIATIDPRQLPAAAGNKLYLDYVSGRDAVASFFTHVPPDFSSALEARREVTYPRQEVSSRLAEYNAGLGAHVRALENIAALQDSATFCVTTGQQAGFMGGPAYTVYKIITAIRLAAYLQETLQARFVPLFWLASEDHDFGEINHVHFVQRDGQVGRVGFNWEQVGHPIADLPTSEEVKQAYQEYLSHLPHAEQVHKWFAPSSNEGFCAWHARIWSKLFSDRGLVIIEPRILRPAASGFFRFALNHSHEIRRQLEEVSQRLDAAGYVPALNPAQAGQLYTFDRGGNRVRIEGPRAHLSEAATHPERFSTDAALRPLFADALLPVAVSVLGPGEIAYQAMLKPLYDLFGIAQPLLLPRKSYTIVSQHEAEQLARYQTNATAVLTEQLDIDAAFQELVPGAELGLFSTARDGVEDALSPLQAYAQSIDPSLTRTWSQTLSSAVRSLEKLEEKAIKARMNQLGFSKRDLLALRDALLPRGRLQERVFPLPHFLSRHGIRFLDRVFSAGDLDDFSHHVLVLEQEHV